MDGSFDSNDKRWRSGFFRPGRLKILSAFIVTLVLILLSSKLFTVEDDAFGDFQRWKKLLNLLHVFTLASFVWLAKVVLRSWKFRGSKFVMEDMPGVIGGKFRGVLVLPNSFADNRKIKVEIVNLKTATRSTSSSEGSSPKTTRLYTDLKYIPISCGEVVGRLIKVPVEFTIPYGTRDETVKEKETAMGGRELDVSYKWMLTARAEIKGADLDLDFEVPIFRTDQSDRDVKEPAKDIYKLQNELLQADGPERVRVIEEAGRKRYAVKGKDHFSHVFCGLLGFCLLCGAAFVVELIFKGFSKEAGKGVLAFLAAVGVSAVWLIGALILVLFGVIAVVAFLKGISRKETWVDYGCVCQRGRFLLYSWEKKIELGRVKDVVSEKYSSNQYSETYRVFVTHEPALSILSRKNPGLKKLEVADDITSKAEAMWLKEELLNAVIEKV